MSDLKNSQAPATMYCRSCTYILDHLPRGRCPECGLVFDRDDSRTFDRYPRTRWSALGEWISKEFARTTEKSHRRQLGHAIGFFLVVLALGAFVIVLDHCGVLHAYAAQ